VEETHGSALGHEVGSAPEAERAEHGAATPARPNDAGGGDNHGQTLLDRTFGRDDITVLRHQVSGCLAAVGFRGDRLRGFVLAINEVITNVALHAGGRGRLVLWLTAGSAWCTVTDSGPGIPARHLEPPDVPGAFEVGGRGIWLTYQLCDEVRVATGPIGTAVGLRLARPGRDQAPDLVNRASASN
jgi:anti-sigma regulatory factor (Ser/Thr protein kinase)